MNDWSTTKILQMALLALVAIVVASWSIFHRTGSMNGYWQRSCNGLAWRKRFPQASKNQLREFLGIFIQSFAFESKHKLKFHPDDAIYAIYRTLYPTLGGADILELECLSRAISNHYSIDFASVWRTDLTLGELYTMVHSRNA